MLKITPIGLLLFFSITLFAQPESQAQLRVSNTTNPSHLEFGNSAENHPIWGGFSIASTAIGLIGLVSIYFFPKVCTERIIAGDLALSCCTRCYAWSSLILFVGGIVGQAFAFEKFWKEAL